VIWRAFRHPSTWSVTPAGVLVFAALDKPLAQVPSPRRAAANCAPPSFKLRGLPLVTHLTGVTASAAWPPTKALKKHHHHCSQNSGRHLARPDPSYPGPNCRSRSSRARFSQVGHRSPVRYFAGLKPRAIRASRLGSRWFPPPGLTAWLGLTASSFLVFPSLLSLGLVLCCCCWLFDPFSHLLLDILPHWRRSHDTKSVSRVSIFPVFFQNPAPNAQLTRR
jgi:hypothetical protein